MMDTTYGVPVPQRYWAVLTVGMAVMMSVLDGAIANVALPTIAKEFYATPAASIWVVNAYQLATVISLLPLSAAGDIYGYRLVYWSGLLVFTCASLMCALSTSLPMLTAARVLQGFGAAGITSVNGALIRTIYPPTLLGRGIGINAVIVATSTAAGPTVAAGILSIARWPWLFTVNVPIGVVALVLSPRALPQTARSGRPFDLSSALLSALMMGLMIAGIDSIGHGEGGGLVGVELVGAVVLGGAFVRRQLSLTTPMLAVDLFRRPVFALSVATSVCSFVAQGIAFVSLPFYFQDVIGRSQVETGLLMTPWPLATAVVAPIAGHLADRYSAGVLGGLGLACLTVGLALVSALPAHPATADIVWRMTICGLGFGFFQSPNNRVILTTVPRDRSGNASGIISTARLLGQTTGAAIVALVFGLVASRAGASGHGETLTIVVAACFAAAATTASTLRLVDFSHLESS